MQRTAKKGLRVLARFAGAIALILMPWSYGASAAEWYSGIVVDFERAGYLSAHDFAPAEPAARGRLTDLLVRIKGGVVHGPFPAATFEDIPQAYEHFFAFEEAALQGWLRGDGNCAGSHPCFAHPQRTVNRAEAAAMLVRAFALTRGPSVPQFSDAAEGAWYTEDLHIAASRCIFRGDDDRGTVRPGEYLNQAEMYAVLRRAHQGLTFPDCRTEGTPLPQAPAELQMQIPLPVPPSSVTSDLAGQSSSSAWLPPVSGSSTSSAASPIQAAVSPSAASSSAAQSASLSVSSVLAQISDARLSMFLSKYNEYVATFGSFLESTKIQENLANLQIVNLLKSQMTMMATYYQYVTIARQRPLAEGEGQVVTIVIQAIEQGFESIRVLKDSGATP